MKNKDGKSFGYAIGYICGTILVLCAMSLIVAMTVKVIMWIV